MRAAITDRRLEAVAGPLLTSRTTAGTTPMALDPMADRTLYAVADIRDYATSWRGIARLGTGYTTGALGIFTAGAPYPIVSGRFDTASGATNLVANISMTGVPFGPEVFWIQIGSGMSLGQVGSRKASAQVAVTPGAGIQSVDLTLLSPSSGCTPLWCGAYLGAHDATTRARIIRWLAQRYQIPM